MENYENVSRYGLLKELETEKSIWNEEVEDNLGFDNVEEKYAMLKPCLATGMSI